MYSLFNALLAQHSRQLTPVRCAHSTIAQLHRYFEDVVLENNLSALVIESLPPSGKRSPREIARLRELARGGRRTFFFTGGHDDLNNSLEGVDFDEKNIAPVNLPYSVREQSNEHFVVIADARFSVLLATVRTENAEGNSGEDEVVWTFEPDIVFSALEYLLARVRAEHPDHASAFGTAVRTSMPKATSLQLTLSVTTKLAHLLQEQAGREIAVNRIATAIRESLELGVILQKTVTEVGAALNVACCALRVNKDADVDALSYSYFAEREPEPALQQAEVMFELDQIAGQVEKTRQLYIREDCDAPEGPAENPLAVVPLIFQDRFIGVLEVIDDDAARTWQDNEILLLRTVANQVAVAIVHAGLYAQMEKQALTDALTGCYNRRSFEMQLDRELQMAARLDQPLALLMLDLDQFKHLNDTAGHDAGDSALRKLGDCFHEELRGVDTPARFGGDEFALILPQADTEGAMIVAERLRHRIEQIEVDGVGHLAASIGVATFPLHASSRAGLVTEADRALYHAKRAGRNRVSVSEAHTPPTESALITSNPNISEAIEHSM
jgi:diguanylate cyclase (GGDEF)-like protein